MQPLPQPAATSPAAPPRVATPAFTVGAAIGRSFSLWWRHLPAFAFVALVLDVPLVAIEAAAGPIEPGHPAFRFDMFLSGVVWAAIQPALTIGTLQALDGERVRLRAMLRAGVTKLYPTFMVQLGSWILISLFAIALVVPGVIVACALWVAVPALVAESVGPSTAMRRARDLAKGNLARIFAVGATLVLVLVVALVALGVASAAAEEIVPPRVHAAVMECAVTVVFALFPVSATVVYHHLRRAREGVPPAELARVFG
jgi:hypothetical protein